MWERRVLLDQETQSSDSATRRVQLPRSGLLSALVLRVRITNGATAGEEHIVDAVDRLEVVANGSEVLYSLEGVEALRWGWLWYGQFPPYKWDESASAVQELVFCVPFGRMFGDAELALDLGAYRDVELRIQYSPTVAATSFATGTTQFHLIGWLNDDLGAGGGRRGFLRTTQLYAFTSVASGEEVIDLPQAYPLYDLLVYAREDAIEDGVDITQVEVRANDRRFIPFTGRWDDIQAENEKMFAIDPTVVCHALRADAAAIDMLTGRIRDVQVTQVRDLAAGADMTVVNPASFAGDRVSMHLAIVEGSATYAATILDTTRREFFIHARGLGIGNAVVVPFALHGNVDLALPAPEFSRLQLALTNGGAGADVRVSARELVAA